jgi:hypothetical protein
VDGEARVVRGEEPRSLRVKLTVESFLRVEVVLDADLARLGRCQSAQPLDIFRSEDRRPRGGTGECLIIGRGEVIRTLDPLHPIELWVFSQ